MSNEPRDWRDERIAELEAENAELRQLLRAALERIAELERQLGMNSQNSSKPPSSDNEKARKKRRRRKKSGRSPGAQEGHDGHCRELLPEEEVDHFHPHFPSHCEECGLELSSHDATGTPFRFQRFELIEKPVECTEHQVFSCQCPGCGETTRATLPAPIAKSGWGPRLTALTATLSAVTRDSRRLVDWVVTHVLGAPSSTGTVQNHLDEVSKALAPGFEQVRAAVTEAPVVGLDETGWRLGNLPHWIWVAESEQAVLYQIEARRKKEVAQRLVGDPGTRIFTTDRYGAYNFLPAAQRQICHAHLLREFTAMAARDGPIGSIGTTLAALSRGMQDQWRKVKAEEMTRAEFVDEVRREVRPEWERLLKRAKKLGKKAPPAVRWLLEKEHIDLAWTFLDHPGVEPTNNGAERALRGPVIQRKLSWGSQSQAGLRLMERLWTTAETCRRQARSVLEYITDAVDAFRNNAPAPILRPL